jgi:trehalose 6-phosphate synthase/phosphatase
MVRAGRPNAKIGFFLHVPFPSRDSFETIPWRKDLLNGILGADFIAFHTPGYLANFLDACRHFGIGQALGEGLRIGDRHVTLGILPLGIDAASWSSEAADLQPETESMLSDLGGERLLLGVDRLDYSKGIPRRLLSVDALLESRPDLVGKIRYLQVGAPSRDDVSAYTAFRRSVQELVGKINGKWATGSWVPIHNIERSLSRSEIIPLYRAADVMVVTPLRDGLNLVAKEFVATRDDEDGVLVLSEFAGGATELAGAVEVNPFDISATADALARALDMLPEERRQRMSTLRARVMDWDANAWFEAFLAEVERAVCIRDEGGAQPLASEVVVPAVRQHSRLRLLLDYDGTLVPFSNDPEAAVPDADLLSLLETLGRRDDCSVHIVTGRSRASIERFLGHLPLTIHAEHGLWSRPADGRHWSANTVISRTWMPGIRRFLEHFVAVVPGSFIEEKATSLAWHYRAASDPEHALSRSREIEDLLLEIGANDGLQVLRGNRVIEIRPRNLHKGLVGQIALRGAVEGELILAAGDDRTDEDLFKSLPAHAITIHVGDGPTSARISVPGLDGLRALLWDVARVTPATSPVGVAMN